MLEKARMTAKELFPDLVVISCWADDNSEAIAKKLQMALPCVNIQPKGLLATEGIMTIPVEGAGKRLTNAHFLSLLTKAASAQAQLALRSYAGSKPKSNLPQKNCPQSLSNVA